MRIFKDESGQVLPLAALFIFILVVVVLTLMTTASLFMTINHLEDSVRYAAEIAARPNQDALATSRMHIDANDANAIARAELTRSLSGLQQMSGIEDMREFVNSDSVTVEVANPPDTHPHCAEFDASTDCYINPAVRVRVVIPITLMLIKMEIMLDRSAIATTGAYAGAGEIAPTMVAPTSVSLPPAIVTKTPSPTP